MKKILEEKSGLIIRRGFDKFIEKTLEFFKIDCIDNITEDTATEIIIFINKSNSKLSESYWILRTDLKEEEYKEQLDIYRKNFMESAYKNTNRKTVCNNINKKFHGRGYSGYVEIEGEKFWCRSKNEFVYFKHLHNIYPRKDGFVIKTEDLIYHYKNMSYKPDVFIYKEDELVQVFEIKDNIKVTEEEMIKCETFKEYFKEKGINFEILNQANIILKKNPKIKEELDLWIEKIATIAFDSRGSKNPNFGMKHSEETKRKIGLKTSERNKDAEYRKKCSISIKNLYTDEQRKKVSEAQKKIQLQKRLELEKIDPTETRICATCSKEFQCRKSSDRKTCVNSLCTYKYNQKMGIMKPYVHSEEEKRKSYINKIVNCLLPLLIEIDFEDYISFEKSIEKLKKESKLRKNLGFSIESINKYFDNFNNFKNIIKNESNKRC